MTARDEGETILVRVPMKQRKRSGRKQIVLPAGAKAKQASNDPPNPLVSALARAYKWQRALDKGDVISLAQLAQQIGVDRSYLGRALRLNSLSPDIVEAILKEDGSRGTCLNRLQNNTPVYWRKQRRQHAGL